MMKFLATLLLVLSTLTGCGRTRSHSAGGYEPSQELLDRYALILEASHEVQDEHGFVDYEKCDSILSSTLAAVGRGERIDIYSARDGVGQWYRRPLSYDECYSSGKSKSTISRDMFEGIFYYLWRTQDLGALRDIQDYGREHGWIMGDGVLSRTPLGFGLEALLGGMVRRLDGQDPEKLLTVPDIWFPNLTDFEAHLQVLHILMYGEVYGYLPDAAANRLREQYRREPRNPLFAYASARWITGDFGAVEATLMAGPWPRDRLATERDYCGPWLVERDYGPNWFPCEQPNDTTRHSGGDWLFVTALLLEASGNKSATF